MGIGNYYLANAKTVYVAHEQVYGEFYLQRQQYDFIDNENDYSFYYHDLIDQIISILPSSFDPCIGMYKFEHGTNRRIIAENGFYRVSIVDWEWCFAVNVELRYAHESEPWEYNPLAVHHHARIARKIFDALQNIYVLRVRSSSWTSGLYQQHTA